MKNIHSISMKSNWYIAICLLLVSAYGCQKSYTEISADKLMDKVKGGWAGQTIGCTYGGPTEFRYCGTMIDDTLTIPWSDGEVEKWYNNAPGLYDDVYVDLTFVDVFDKYGLTAPADSFAMAFLRAGYPLCHANQMARYNLRRGIMPPASGHWLNNPHADCLDFQIEADFAGIMSPGMPNTASEICDRIGHIMSYGNGWYGGVYVAAMYSLAYTHNNVDSIVIEALKTIPQESSFYQCMADVIAMYKANPTDWRKTWSEVEQKWGSVDFGCPDGVEFPFNIETPINAAYIIMGLLYGQGDFEKTMDVSTRCGQDSDCNPANAAGILGTMLGYSNIPDKWRNALPRVEDRSFSHTHISLNKAYELSYNQALQLIAQEGGKVEGERIFIASQTPKPVRLEKSFEGVHYIGKEILTRDIRQLDSVRFEGTGVVLKGMVQGQGDPEYVAQVEISLNGKPVEVIDLPLFFDHRKHELFFNYQLPKGEYLLTARWINPIEGVDIWCSEALFYSDEPRTAPKKETNL